MNVGSPSDSGHGSISVNPVARTGPIVKRQSKVLFLLYKFLSNPDSAPVSAAAEGKRYSVFREKYAAAGQSLPGGVRVTAGMEKGAGRAVRGSCQRLWSDSALGHRLING